MTRVSFLPPSGLEGPLHILDQPDQRSDAGPRLFPHSSGPSLGSLACSCTFQCPSWPHLMTGCFRSVSSIPTVSTTALAPGYQGALHPDLSMGRDYISSCLPDVSPETSSDTHKSQAQVVIMPPPNLLLLHRSRAPQDRNLGQRWAPPPSLHTQQPNGRWVPESLHLKQVSSSALSIPTGTANSQLPCPAPMAC